MNRNDSKMRALLSHCFVIIQHCIIIAHDHIILNHVKITSSATHSSILPPPLLQRQLSLCLRTARTAPGAVPGHRSPPIPGLMPPIYIPPLQMVPPIMPPHPSQLTTPTLPPRPLSSSFTPLRMSRRLLQHRSGNAVKSDPSNAFDCAIKMGQKMGQEGLYVEGKECLRDDNAPLMVIVLYY